MSEQGALFVPTAQGEQPVPLQARLIARRNDPVTSKRAARKVAASDRVNNSLLVFLALLDVRKNLTAREAADMTEHPDYWRVEFDKRVKAWSVAGHIELTVEVRYGGRVWRIRP